LNNNTHNLSSNEPYITSTHNRKEQTYPAAEILLLTAGLLVS